MPKPSPEKPDALAQARAIMASLVNSPHKPHEPLKGKPEPKRRSNPKKAKKKP